MTHTAREMLHANKPRAHHKPGPGAKAQSFYAPTFPGLKSGASTLRRGSADACTGRPRPRRADEEPSRA